MDSLSLNGIALYVGLAAVMAVGSGAVGLVGWALRRQGEKLLYIFTAMNKMSDPENGLQTRLRQLGERVDANNVTTGRDISEIKEDVKQLRTNGHMFADRVSGIERRVQQGAEELNDLRREVHKDDAYC